MGLTTVAKFSPSGYWVASGGTAHLVESQVVDLLDVTGSVRVWDAVGADMNLKTETKVISGRINDIAWDGESQRIIAVGDGKERYGHAFTFDSGNTVGEVFSRQDETEEGRLDKWPFRCCECRCNISKSALSSCYCLR